MWKLTIEQERKSEFTNGMFTEKITVKSSDLSELTMLIERFTHCESDCETTYKIEKAGE